MAIERYHQLTKSQQEVTMDLLPQGLYALLFTGEGHGYSFMSARSFKLSSCGRNVDESSIVDMYLIVRRRVSKLNSARLQKIKCWRSKSDKAETKQSST